MLPTSSAACGVGWRRLLLDGAHRQVVPLAGKHLLTHVHGNSFFEAAAQIALELQGIASAITVPLATSAANRQGVFGSRITAPPLGIEKLSKS